MSRITVIGLGAMGSALAEALIARGHEVTVWNRSPQKAQRLAAQGAAHASSVAEALAASPLVILCVLDYAAANAILKESTDRLAGRTLVNLTNGTPSQAAEMAAWVRGFGADYIDGGVMVTPELVGQPGAFVLYSGLDSAYRKHEPILAAFGEPVYVGEDASLAAVHDLALLSAMFGMFGGYLHAAALLRSKRIPTAEVTPRIASLLQAMIGLLPETADQIDAGRYPQPTSNNRMMAAGLKNILEGSTEQAVRTDLMEPIRALFARGVDEGLGDVDISALVPLLAASNHVGDHRATQRQ